MVYRVRDPEGLEPKWKQTPEIMVACLEEMVTSTREEYSSTNWALWQIAKLKADVNGLGAYADGLEAQVAAARRALRNNDIEGLIDALGGD